MVQTKNSLEGEILDKSPSTCKEGHSQVFAWVQTTDPPIAWDGTLGKCFLAPTVACGPCFSEIPALLITGGIPLSPPYTDLQLLRVIYSVFLHRCNYRNFFLRRFSSLSFLTLLFLFFFFFSLFRLPKSFWSLSLSLCSQCWINILYWEIDHRALGYRCLTRAPTPVSNGDGRGTVKLEPIKSASRAFGRASSGTFPNNQKEQQCKLLEVVSPSWGQENCEEGGNEERRWVQE